MFLLRKVRKFFNNYMFLKFSRYYEVLCSKINISRIYNYKLTIILILNIKITIKFIIAIFARYIKYK